MHAHLRISAEGHGRTGRKGAVSGPFGLSPACRGSGRPDPREPMRRARCTGYGCEWRPVHIDDDTLIARARSGDVAAYEELVRRYQDVARRTAHLVSPEADADDAVQDAFLKAYAALDRFRPGAPLRPWLLRIVANEARNRRRSAGRRGGLALRAAAPGMDAHGGPDPEAAVIATEARSELLAAIRSLRDDDREILGARFFLDLSEAETAVALGLPRGTVKSRTSRALGRLRDVLATESEEVGR